MTDKICNEIIELGLCDSCFDLCRQKCIYHESIFIDSNGRSYKAMYQYYPLGYYDDGSQRVLMFCPSSKHVCICGFDNIPKQFLKNRINVLDFYNTLKLRM